jgi:Fe2+ or Zn2+ uptake regulation protein
MGEIDDPLALELRARGLRATPQRLVLAGLLRDRPRHVTAEELFAEARTQLPGLSLPTVYATLDLLAEVGAVRQVPLPSGAAVYDSRPEPHHHVRCRRCGAVQDLDVELDEQAALRSAERHGFAEVDAALVVSGVCAACRDLH